jgi:septal ring factor EnvC (AmiA/AmiB activator)
VTRTHGKDVSITALVTITILIVSVFTPGFADDLDERKNELTEIKKEIEEKKERIRESKSEEKTILQELTEMDASLDKRERELVSLEYDMETTTEKIEQIKERISDVEADIARLQGLIEVRLVALYKLNDAGYVPVMFSSTDYTDVRRRMKYLSAIVRTDQQLLAEYQNLNDALNDDLDELETKRDELKLLTEEVARKKLEIGREKAKRGDYLAEVKKERGVYEAALTELEESKKKLTALIDTLLEERAKETERVKMEGHDHTSPSAGGVFASLKGDLPRPVSGPIITDYGTGTDPIYNNPIFNKGIEIQADEGVDFISVAMGQVIYADYFEGYGNLIIIDHGDSYYTIYAHARDVLVSVGDTVSSGEVIGTVGDTGSLKGPNLYFEIRHHGNTSDPESWLASQ